MISTLKSVLPNPDNWGRDICDECNSRNGMWGYEPTKCLTCEKCGEKKRNRETSEEEHRRQMAKKELENTSIKNAKESEEKTKRDKYATDAAEETKRLNHAKDSEEETKRHEKDVEERIKQLEVECKVKIEEEITKQTQAKEENQTKRAEAIEETKQFQAEENTKMIMFQIQVLNKFQLVTQSLEIYPEEERKHMFATLISILGFDVSEAKGRSCAPPIQEQYEEA